MLSICIPIYNWDVTELVRTLHDQLSGAGCPFEIRLRDDASLALYRIENEPLGSLEGVHYHQNESNMGRARIRNVLAQDAIYNKLIFLDSDSKIISSDFISNYFEHIDKPVVYGGTYYGTTPPQPEKRLHWYYGKEREAMQASLRMLRSYRTFKTNNFMVDKDILLSCPFDEQIEKYGYEDNVWSMALHKLDIPIYHIDNEVEHLGLQDADDFLHKTEEAVHTLHDIINRSQEADIRLSEVVHFFHKTRLSPIIIWLYDRFNKSAKNRLKANYKLLKLLDFIKLGLILKLTRAKN